MRIKILDDDGVERWMPVEDVLRKPDPGPIPLFRDRFNALSIEDGQSEATGATYTDSFAKWGVRRLADKPNLDQGVKRHIPNLTHEITKDGLVLRAFPDDSSETGYYAGMISMERSWYFETGIKITIPTKFNIGPGIHFTHWLMPGDGKGLPEFDMLEVIGSNKHAPNGPINALFFNAKDASVGNWHQHDVPPGFLNEFHDYSLIWTDDRLTWMVDGQVVHSAPNLYHGRMYYMATIEVGASSNGDFPGPINNASVWPSEVTMKEILVERA